MQIEWGIAIAIGGFLIAIGSFIIGYFTFHKNRDKDIVKDARDSAAIGAKLDHISGGVDSMRVDLKTHEHRLTTMSESLIRVEESSKQAHKRIDGLERNEH